MDLMVAAHVERVGEIAINTMSTTHVLRCIRLSSALVTIGVSRHLGVPVLFCLTIDGWFVSADIEDHAAAEAGWKRRDDLIIILR